MRRLPLLTAVNTASTRFWRLSFASRPRLTLELGAMVPAKPVHRRSGVSGEEALAPKPAAPGLRQACGCDKLSSAVIRNGSARSEKR